MNKEYLELIARMDLTTYHYKLLLLLNVKAYNQSQLSSIFNISRQNINVRMKKLKHLNLIEIDRIEGKNKFYKAVTNVNKINSTIPGQIEF